MVGMAVDKQYLLDNGQYAVSQEMSINRYLSPDPSVCGWSDAHRMSTMGLRCTNSLNLARAKLHRFLSPELRIKYHSM